MKGSSSQISPRRVKSRILVVDNHPLVREGLRQLIQQQTDLEGCGEVGSYAAAQKILATTQPDLVTLEIHLQGGDGLEWLKTLKAERPEILTLVISQCDELLYAERALKAGARGYITKERTTDEVLAAIRTVLAGGHYVSPRIAALALTRMISDRPGKNQHDLQNLTNRELQVLQLLGAGLGTRKASVKLGLSVKTVEAHRENIKRKLRLATAAELVRYATDWLNGQPSQHLPAAAKSNPKK